MISKNSIPLAILLVLLLLSPVTSQEDRRIENNEFILENYPELFNLVDQVEAERDNLPIKQEKRDTTIDILLVGAIILIGVLGIFLLFIIARLFCGRKNKAI